MEWTRGFVIIADFGYIKITSEQAIEKGVFDGETVGVHNGKEMVSGDEEVGKYGIGEN